MTRFVHPAPEDLTLDAVLHALADPARRQILINLAMHRSCGGQGLPCSAAAPDAVPKSTISHHFAVLRAAGLVRAERRGVEVIHHLRCQDLETRFPGLLANVLKAHGKEAVSQSGEGLLTIIPPADPSGDLQEA